MAKKDDTKPEGAEAALQPQADGPATDDAAPVAVTPAADAPVEPPAEEPAPAVVEEPAKSARERVADRFNEIRRERAEVTEVVPTTAVDDETPAPVVATPAAPAAPEADEPIIKLKVDGREVELPLSEVRNLAQTNIAISARQAALADLNTEIAARRAERERLSGQAPAGDTPTDRQPAQPPAGKVPQEATNLDERQLRDLAERISSGTLEEQVDALKEFASAVTKAQEPVDVDARITAHLNRERAKSDAESAIEEFAAAYPVVADDPHLERIAYDRAIEGMYEDLQAAGVSARDMARLRKEADNVNLLVVHQDFARAMRADGTRAFPNVRSREALLKDAGEFVVSRYAPRQAEPQPQPAPKPLADRAERKAGLTPQPRGAQVRAQPPAPASSTARTSPRDVVREMATRRGQRA